MKPQFRNLLVTCVRVGRVFLYSIVAVLCTTLLVAGQSGLGTGRVEGTVVDRSDAAIADASVTALNMATHVSTVQKSDSTGHFLIPYLAPGNYHVTIEKSG